MSVILRCYIDWQLWRKAIFDLVCVFVRNILCHSFGSQYLQWKYQYCNMTLWLVAHSARWLDWHFYPFVELRHSWYYYYYWLEIKEETVADQHLGKGITESSRYRWPGIFSSLWDQEIRLQTSLVPGPDPPQKKSSYSFWDSKISRLWAVPPRELQVAERHGRLRLEERSDLHLLKMIFR